MGNYSEEHATLNASHITIIQKPSDLQARERNEARWEEGERATKRRRDERVFLQEEEEEETYSVRSDLTKGGASRLFSLSQLFFFFLKGKSTVKHQPHINGAWQTFNSNLSDFRGFYWRCVSSFMPVKSIVKFQEEDLFENNSLHSGSHLPAVPLSLLSTWTAEPIWTFISTESPATSKAAFRDVGTSRWLRDDIGQEKHKKVGLHSQLKYASIEFQLNLFSCFYWFMVVWVTVLLDGLYLTLWGLSRHWWWALSNPNPNSNPGLAESFCIDLFFQGL